ncbi:MAG: BamA/TamA family outer membrane protein, partial [Giesbergeria sp.]|nr:BamA/TamA family outer membrane protein [Giesbergeria sp.]
NRQPQGGESYHTANIELRQQVQSNLWASIFIDAGNVGLRADDLIADLRYGIGAGLRYLLPVGALRLDYAWNPDRREGDSSYQIFLTVGMAF